MRKLLIAVAGVAIFCAVYTGVWLSWRSGSTMATSEWAQMLKKSRIVVKKIPSSAPFWAVPLSFLPDDNPSYRCECYLYGASVLFSAQTYAGESLTAQTARIEWDNKGSATVYLDHNPVLKCDSQGYWTKAR